MIAQSQSGTGKTAAFVLTILSRIDYSKPKSPQALCLAPSRELARQIEGVIRTIGQFEDRLTVQAAIPGAYERNQKIEAMVVVGTPGTVMDLIKRRQFDTKEMKVMCLDEADNMLDQQGLGEQCIRVKTYVASFTIHERCADHLQFDAKGPDSGASFLRHIPRNGHEIRTQVQPKCKRNLSQA
jgi:ATP-dependent RNA helicase DDX19/DBP5